MAMSAAQKRGLVVGKDISITGFDNIPMAEVAELLDTNINNIYKLLHDARLKLKQGLQNILLLKMLGIAPIISLQDASNVLIISILLFLLLGCL